MWLFLDELKKHGVSLKDTYAIDGVELIPSADAYHLKLDLLGGTGKFEKVFTEKVLEAIHVYLIHPDAAVYNAKREVTNQEKAEVNRPPDVYPDTWSLRAWFAPADDPENEATWVRNLRILKKDIADIGIEDLTLKLLEPDSGKPYLPVEWIPEVLKKAHEHHNFPNLEQVYKWMTDRFACSNEALKCLEVKYLGQYDSMWKSKSQLFQGGGAASVVPADVAKDDPGSESEEDDGSLEIQIQIPHLEKLEATPQKNGRRGTVRAMVDFANASQNLSFDPDSISSQAAVASSDMSSVGSIVSRQRKNFMKSDSQLLNSNNNELKEEIEELRAELQQLMRGQQQLKELLQKSVQEIKATIKGGANNTKKIGRA